MESDNCGYAGTGLGEGLGDGENGNEGDRE